MIALISARQELQLVPARSERPTAFTLVLPGRTAAAICKMPTPKQVAGNGEGLQSLELVSILAEPMKPFISVLETQ